MGWVLRLDQCVMLIRATTTSHPFIWIKGGIAHAIPRSEELALFVGTGNKDLVVGRLCLSYGEDVAMVQFDETIFGECISFNYEPSIQEVVTRFETSVQYTVEWSQKALERFGGQPFTPDDWHLMSLPV